jgi:putative DNA methylase
MTADLPKRLIEVDLPIKRISAHARREKSIRHGHISTLHIWWARRPLAACRAVICASLWPDPVDVTADDVERARKDGKAVRLNTCPAVFRDFARKEMLAWTTHERQKLLSPESRVRFEKARQNPAVFNDPVQLRGALLDFIADFCNWDNSTVREYLDSSRALTRLAHAALGGVPGARPLVVDPFAGGGSIPLEALRVGADAFASDLNPVPVLLNKITLEYIPRYGTRLADEIRKWGAWVRDTAEMELAKFYPKDADGSTPIAYLWARTIQCEGPNCGADLPLIGQTWLSTREGRECAFRTIKNAPLKRLEIALAKSPKPDEVMPPISKKSSVTCPLCGYTTPAKRVREVLAKKNGGSDSARLLAVVTSRLNQRGKSYRTPGNRDFIALKAVSAHFAELDGTVVNGLSAIPDESAPPDGALGFRFQKYGIRRWRDLYTKRQLVALTTLARLVTSPTLRRTMTSAGLEEQLQNTVLSCLALAVGRVNDLSSTLCRWLPSLEAVAASNGGQNKMPMILDFVEANPIGGAGGDWSGQIDWIARVVENLAASDLHIGSVARAAAQRASLPDDSAAAMVTDPPYYSAFGYSDLSEFFFPWLHRSVPPSVLDYSEQHVPKAQEAVSIGKTLSDDRGEKSDKTYLDDMRAAFQAYKRVVRPDGIGVVVFANKTTAGWEAILEALISAGWMITASWPLDTERPNRQRAIGSAALQSSVHLVCRPRENAALPVLHDVGDWRDVLQKLPRLIHEWMPRLAEEGVVGADAIFACLGPALEMFSRYSRVEKASGEVVSLKDYLEHVWAVVSQEALSTIFAGASTEGFEPDARLTAMWLWTLSAGRNGDSGSGDEEEAEDDNDTEPGVAAKATKGFVLEYDAARKIAQGLGANLESLASVVEVTGEAARLIPVAERTRKLFGKDEADSPARKQPKKSRQLQLGFVEELEHAEKANEWGSKGVPELGITVLDRVHQCMILFAAGRAEAVRRFLINEGVGADEKFWRLAQVLSYMYPKASDEKRWIDGVLARKKGLGF